MTRHRGSGAGSARCWLLGWLAALVVLVGGGGRAQPVAAAAGALAVFPPVAAPGERAWLIARADIKEGTAIWIGAQAARLSRDTPGGWYAFTVPPGVSGGPQPVGLNGPGRGDLRLSVVPKDALGEDLAVYLRADLAGTFGARYRERLLALAAACARLCPPELTATVVQLAATKIEGLEPLGGRTQRAATPPMERQPLARALTPFSAFSPQVLGATRLETVLRAPTFQRGALAGPGGTGLCGQLGGRLSLGALPAGRAIGLLNLLFWGEMGLDPSLGTHPAQALGAIPHKGSAPADVVRDVLGLTRPGGRGVTIHVLDTAGPVGDPFVMGEDVNYYNEVYAARPGHGSVVGEVARAVAPGAKVAFQAVCQGDTCPTLDVVRALCTVAAQARAGGKHVVNLSLGGAYPNLGVLLALNELAGLGVPTAASYGNRDDCSPAGMGDVCHHYPADWSRDFATSGAPGAPTMLLSVAGWDLGGREYATYNRTATVPWAGNALPSVLAPGEFWSGGLPYFGTSFAAPVVAGVLANWMGCRPGVPVLPMVTAPGARPLPPAVVNACP